MTVPVAPRDDVAMMDGYHSPQVDVEVRLNTNESPLPPSAEFVAAVAAAVGDVAWHRYPDRLARELRGRLAELHGVRADQVFVANGSNEVLQTLSLTYAGPGRSVALFEPTYAMHSHIARVTGAAVAEGRRGEDLALDLDEVRMVGAHHRLGSPGGAAGELDAGDRVGPHRRHGLVGHRSLGSFLVRQLVVAVDRGADRPRPNPRRQPRPSRQHALGRLLPEDQGGHLGARTEVQDLLGHGAEVERDRHRSQLLQGEIDLDDVQAVRQQESQERTGASVGLHMRRN